MKSLLLLIATLCLSISAQNAPIITPTPKAYYKQAMHHAKNNNLALSLPLFHAATRGDPTNPAYLNNLGVTEMRLNLLASAKLRFKHVLLLNDNYANAIDNLIELRTFMTEDEWNNADSHINSTLLSLGLLSPSKTELQSPSNPKLPSQLHRILPLPRVTLSELLTTERHYLSGDFPFLLTNAMNTWDLTLWSLDNLASTFPNTNVDHYPQNMGFETVRPFFTTLEKGIKQFSIPTGVYEGVDASFNNAYIQWNVNYNDWNVLKGSFKMDLPPLFNSDDDWIHSCFPNDDDKSTFQLRTHWRMLLIGQKGAGMFNHKDTLKSSSFQAQVKGRKRWHICDDSDHINDHIYNAGKVNMFAPDYNKYPNALNLTCYQVDVNAGEMIYYPQNYWHQTLSLDSVSIAASGTLVTRGNHLEMIDEFGKQCSGTKKGGRVFSYEKGLCEGLKVCEGVWKGRDWEGEVSKLIDAAAIDVDGGARGKRMKSEEM